MKVPLPALRLATAALALLSTTGCRLNHAAAHVAFIGDSLTEGWRYPTANYGVHGNTTAKMLARFEPAIAGREYTVVVILGGTNDVLFDVDPAQTIHNLEQMAQRATQLHAEPILCEIPPIFHSYRRGDTRDFSSRVNNLNRAIVQLAASHHYKLVDYYTPLASHPNYFSDGVHPNRRGYLKMEAALLRQLHPY